MPVATSGCMSPDLPNTLTGVFLNNVYADYSDSEAWKLTAAISGAHTLGATEMANSGFDGTWSDAENMGIFNNDYYKSILFKGWTQENVT